MVALLGQNGAGKTTCAKLFNGIHKPTAGVVRVAGHDTRALAPSALARHVGYCYQNPNHQIWALKVADEVSFGPRNLGLDEEAVSARVDEALELVSLERHRDAYTFNLGWGERQQLAVASILAMRPEVIVVDEPTTGLDARGSRRIMDLLTNLNAQGLTLVVITHDMSIVAEYLPRTVCFRDGRAVYDGPTGQLMWREPELLASANLRPPPIVRLVLALGYPELEGSVRNAEDLRRWLRDRLRGNERHVG